MLGACCPRCAGAVALHEGRPHVATNGSVELWHRTCWDTRDVPFAAAIPKALPIAPIARTKKAPSKFAVRAVIACAAGSAAVGLLLAQWSWLEVEPAPPVAMVALAVEAQEPVAIRTGGATHEAMPIRAPHVDTQIEARWPVPDDDNGLALDEKYPTLRNWTHPVIASPELVPTQASRLFGVPRLGIEIPRPECGEGHCGIDLDGPRGRPIVSVADGIVVRVERHEMGLDGMSGRYVRIAHADGTLTAYMHLDEVADRLEVGDRVIAGQYIGTLGATATYGAPPHCHFSLELPNHEGKLTDTTDTRYVDPAPFLARSTIIAVPLRMPEIKPSF